MSVEALTWVLKHSASKGTTRCVLMAIADQAGSDGTNAWPSHATLARHSNTSVSSVKRSISWLRDHGELLVEVGAGGTADCPWDKRPNRYTVVMAEGAIPDRGSVADRGSESAEPGSTGETDRGSTLTYNPPLTHPDPPMAPTVVDASERSSLRSAVIEACAIDPVALTRSADGALAKAVREIADVGGTAADVPKAALTFKAKFPAATLTPLALSKHWAFSPAAARPVPTLSEAERFGISLGRSESDHLEAEDAIAGQFDEPGDRATAMDAWQRTRRQGVSA